MAQKRTGTADYTTPVKPTGPDALLELDAEYERLSGKPGLLYSSKAADHGRMYHFGTGEIRTSRASAIRYLKDLLKEIAGARTADATIQPNGSRTG